MQNLIPSEQCDCCSHCRLYGVTTEIFSHRQQQLRSYAVIADLSGAKRHIY